jgi:hypothetical protein
LYINAQLSQLPVVGGRKTERRVVNIAAALREAGATTHPVIVLDISVGGFKIDSGQPLELGAEVWLKLSGFEAKRSKVVWVDGNDAGCEFENPLHQKDLDILVAPPGRRLVKNVFRRV